MTTTATNQRPNPKSTTAQHGVYLDDEHCCNKQFFRNHQSCCGAEKRFDRAFVDVNFLVEHGDLASEQAVTAVAHASIIPENMHGNVLERPWERANKGAAWRLLNQEMLGRRFPWQPAGVAQSARAAVL